MPAETSPGTGARAVPSMLDLVRLSPRRLFPPGGEELYRQIALLTEMRPGLEVLDVASGKGVPLEYFVTPIEPPADSVTVRVSTTTPPGVVTADTGGAAKYVPVGSTGPSPMDSSTSHCR